MILVTGATGTNGREIVTSLSRLGIPVRALVRSGERAKMLAGLPHVEIVYGDFAQPASLAPALDGVTKALLISAIDPMMPELQGNFVRAAQRAGAPHVVKFSGMGAAFAKEWRFARWHVEAEKVLEDSGLTFTHLRPNQFMQVYLRFQPTISAMGKFFGASRDSRVSPVDIRDIAAVAVAVLTTSGHDSKTYEITGPEALTYAEIADKLSSALGRKVTYVDVPLEASMKVLSDSGMPGWFVEGQAEQFRVRWRGGQSALTTVVTDVANKEPITFERFARDHAAYFASEIRTPDARSAS